MERDFGGFDNLDPTGGANEKRDRPNGTPHRSGARSSKAIAREDTGERHASRPTRLPGVLAPLCGVVESQGSTRQGDLAARAKAAKQSGKAQRRSSPWNVHDLRRTVATGLQRLGVRLEVTEAVLNHISGSRGGIAGVYQRHDGPLRNAPRSIPGRLTLARLLGTGLPLPTS